jgi:hypothetical protein
MGTKRVGLARTQALIENLKRSINWNEATLTDCKITTGKTINVSGDINFASTTNADFAVWAVPNLHNKVAISGNTTLSNATHCFHPILVTADCTVTLPAVAEGASYWIINNQDHGTKIRIDPDDSDKFVLTVDGSAGTNGKYVENTAATARRGDFLCCTYSGANKWVITRLGGTWTEES